MKHITITLMNTSSFEGTVSDQDLSDLELIQLGLTRLPHTETDIPVYADYVLEWDDDIPMPQIESLVVLGRDGKELSLNETQYSIDTLQDEVSQNGPDSEWREDKHASLCDSAYDSYRDRMMEESQNETNY